MNDFSILFFLRMHFSDHKCSLDSPIYRVMNVLVSSKDSFCEKCRNTSDQELWTFLVDNMVFS